MSSTETARLVVATAPEPDEAQINSARERLAELDASVFAGAVTVSPIQQNDLVRRAVRRLFGHGL